MVDGVRNRPPTFNPRVADQLKPSALPQAKGEAVASAQQTKPLGWVAEAAPRPALMNDDAELMARLNATQDKNVALGLPRSSVLDSMAYKWEPVGDKGKLYIDDVSYQDVVQGGAGDCYFVSSLASLAKVDPGAIKDAIKQNDDGTYTVRFFEKGAKGAMKPVYVTVSDELVMSEGRPLYLRSTTDKTPADAEHPIETWGPIMEKAYATWKGGFQQIGDGGRPEEAILALTGKTAQSDLPLLLEPKQVFDRLKQAIAKHHPTTASTWPTNTNGGQQSEALGLVSGHAFTVLSVGEEGGQKYVEVRNPHGKNPNRPDDGGIMRVPLKDFVKGFSKIVY